MENKINYLFEQFKNIENENEEFQSHILNYICILQSGYLEKTIQNLLKDYKTSTHWNSNECKNNIKLKVQNAKWCSIRPTFLTIDISIVTRLKELDNFENIIDSINNIVGTRHKIAHGETVTNLTLSILKSDFENIKLFLDKLQIIFETYN